jgi:hypothetical protein
MRLQTEHRFEVKDDYRMVETGVLSPGYSSKTVLGEGNEAKPVAFSDVAVDVTDLLKR